MRGLPVDNSEDLTVAGSRIQACKGLARLARFAPGLGTKSLLLSVLCSLCRLKPINLKSNFKKTQYND